MGLSSSPIKIWDKSVQGYLIYDRTNKQTNRDYNFIYIDVSAVVTNEKKEPEMSSVSETQEQKH